LVTADPDEKALQRRVKIAHFPLELLLITALYAFAYGRDALGCSSDSTAPQGPATASTAPPGK
jgi:hypothetical protein